ncbi:MAG: RimK family alpha-L-glutamate ligase [Patescibacteria group bacterium]
MKLVLINNHHNLTCEEYLVRAAKRRNLDVEVINPMHALQTVSPMPKSRELLYRIGITFENELFEATRIAGGAISFREDNYLATQKGKFRVYSLLAKNEIPVPPTIISGSTDENVLKKIAKEFGFPLVLKATTGSRGKGTLLVDSFFSLKSNAELLVAQRVGFLYQKFIRETVGRHIRVIVVGDEIVCAYQKSARGGTDFRSNTSSENARRRVKITPEIRDIITRTTRAVNCQFGGIDLLYGRKGFIVTEVNFSCNFAAAQDFTGINIAQKMVDYLIAKAKQKKVKTPHA